MNSRRRIGAIAAVAAAPLALAYRFAVVYRRRAGIPRPQPPRFTPAFLGLAFDATIVPSDGLELPAWFVPARAGRPGPGVVLVHGWESARDRTLPMMAFLHAAGFHCLAFDVRGHGANPPEVLPVSAGEFGRDARAAARALLGRPEVTSVAIVGHSLGGIGAILAAAAEPAVAAVAATSAPADPDRLTRQTFRLAGLPIPGPIAWPLAWLTTRVYLRPRGHAVREVSASTALRSYRGAVFLAHGDEDEVVPIAHLARLERAARAPRRDGGRAAMVESIIIGGGRHSWLYEEAAYRRAVARFLAEALGGPRSPEEAGQIAAATPAERLPDAEIGFSAVEGGPAGFRALAEVVRPARPATAVGSLPAERPGGDREAADQPADEDGRAQPQRAERGAADHDLAERV